MRVGPTAEETEEMVPTHDNNLIYLVHCWKQYKADKTAAASSNAGGDTTVIVMDFSQNLTVPSVSSTPSQWYFCSLINVSVFGIYYENDGMQTNYIYDETVSGKGTDQINSMLQHFIRTTILPSGKKKLVVYADNCSDQNKKHLVIKFQLAQVQMGLFERVDYKFFVKGHTKNSCDRGFGHIRKHAGRQDPWTMDQVVAAGTAYAVSNATVHISRGDDFFMHYKPLVT
ncbi:hypothetical protein PR001_g10124 [Phytophthora rubi]|uniref:DUF7869 domain-containing protein n=1 Tax=Phytophthora rubi TaxID=129364 RepID=A0A6A3MWC4_9STRA|nr:hypothetical protein PR001_g10124 [Phytophthora rubi]